MNNAKRGKISPFQFFAILTVSRIVVSLTYIQSVTVGIMSFDIALGLIFAAFFTMFTELSFAFSEKCVMMRAHKNMEVQYYGLCYWRRLCQLRYLR